MPDTVIKLGGSLLGNTDFPLQLRELIEQTSHSLEQVSNQSSRIWVVVGGGILVDAVRRWDDAYHLPDRLAHELALDAMSLTAGLVAELSNLALAKLPATGISTFLLQWRADHPGLCDVVDVSAAAKADPAIPASWNVTSDSLALWFCQQIGAKQLILAKSVAPLEATMKISKIQNLGWIDPYFSGLWNSNRKADLKVQIAHLCQDEILFTSIEH